MGPRMDKSPDKIDSLVYALSMLNLNTYAGSDFEISMCVTPRSQEVGFSTASSERFEDIWQDDGY